MANIYTIKSGNASDPTVWSGGVVPVSGDRVLIMSAHTVTLDGAYEWGDDSTAGVVINTVSTTASIFVSGTLKASRSVSSSLTCKGVLAIMGNIDFGTEADPIPASVSATIIMNKSGVMAAGKYGITTGAAVAGFRFWGATKTSHSVISSLIDGSSFVVADATGWAVGDVLFLGPTVPGNATVEVRAIASITPGAGTTATVVLGAAVTNANYVDRMLINVSRNVKITSHQLETYANSFTITIGSGAASNALELGNLEIAARNTVSSGAATNINSTGSGKTKKIYRVSSHDIVSVTGSTAVTAATPAITFYQSTISLRPGVPAIECTSCAKANANLFCLHNSGYVNHVSPAGMGGRVAFTNNTNSGTSHAFIIDNPKISGSNSVAAGSVFGESVVAGGSIDGYTALTLSSDNPSGGGFVFRGVDLTGVVGVGSPGGFVSIGISTAAAKITLDGCDLPDTFSMLRSSQTFSNGTVLGGLILVNKDNNPAIQEQYNRDGKIERDNTTALHGTSSIKISPWYADSPLSYEIDVPVAANETVLVKGATRWNTAYTSAYPPSVVLSGLGITPQEHINSAAVDTWQDFTLTATNPNSYPGSLKLTLTAETTANTDTAFAWFDGMAVIPYIVTTRYYGYLFDNSVSLTADPYVVLSEAAAGALTGCTINGGTKHITFGVGTIDTASELYDYSRYWSVANMAQEVPFERAGSLYSLASGWTVVEPSIAGITWGGGTIDWTTPGAKNGGFDSNVFDFQAAGTYDFVAASLSGTIEFINTSGGAVIVNVPAGTTYTNTGPNITVNVAVDQAEALISGIVAGSRLQIYNVTTATEMVNAINATTSYTLGYPNGTGYSAGDVIRVRLTYCVGLTAKLPVEYVTIASAAGWSVLANQQDDEVYIANGIDGSTVTEYSSDYVNVQIDLSDPDGVTSIQRGYAWYCYQMTLIDGIRYFFDAFIAEDAYNYLFNTDVADIKVQNTGASGVTLTGGALRRKDGSNPIASGGSVYIYYGRAYSDVVTVTGSNVVTGDLADIAPAVWGHETRTLTSGVGGGASADDVWNHNKALSVGKFLGLK